MASAGTYQVHAVRYGTRTTDHADVFLNHEVYGQPNAAIGMDYYFWVLRNDERTVLVDIGYDPEVGARRGRTLLVDPMHALAGLGVSPAAVEQVIVTHAHYDHIGNLRHMTGAEVVIARSEFDFWTGPLAARAQFACSAETAELAHLAAAREQGRITTFTSRHTPAPGIEVVEVGGHTPGQAIVLVDTADGQVLLASDAVHYYEEYERDWPFTFVADLPAMYRAFDLVRDMLTDPRRSLVAGHDPDVPARFAGSGPALLDGLAVCVG